jgi:hypothetical protein
MRNYFSNEHLDAMSVKGKTASGILFLSLDDDYFEPFTAKTKNDKTLQGRRRRITVDAHFIALPLGREMLVSGITFQVRTSATCA